MPSFRYDVPDFKPRSAMEEDTSLEQGNSFRPGSGEFDPNDPYWNSVIQQRLNQEFNPADLAAAQAAAGGASGGGGNVSRVAALYDQARQSTRQQATAARQGTSAAYDQYKNDVAASAKLTAPGVGVQAPPPQIDPKVAPDIAGAVGNQAAAMDQLAKQRSESYAAAAATGAAGAQANINATELENIGKIDIESASALAEAGAKDRAASSGGADVSAQWNQARRARETELRDQILANHGVDPITGERAAPGSQDVSKLNADEAFTYMTNAYGDYLNSNGKGSDWRNSRAGKVYEQMAAFAGKGQNDTTRYANFNTVFNAFFHGPKNQDAWLKNVAAKTGIDMSDPAVKQASIDTYNAIYSKGGGVLTGKVLSDWGAAQFGKSNPLAAGYSQPKPVKAPKAPTSRTAPPRASQRASGPRAAGLI